jgi:hypothetical protein
MKIKIKERKKPYQEELGEYVNKEKKRFFSLSFFFLLRKPNKPKEDFHKITFSNK